MLSIATPGCGNDAAAGAAGLAGLVHSAALGAGYGGATGQPRLHPSELRQLLAMTADDIDIAESREPSSTLFESQPGFEPRFGYGRANAWRAVRWVRDGRIPPKVEITSPSALHHIDPAQASVPLKIFGSVQAERATRYAYTIDVAPGESPLDVDFLPLAHATGIPGATLTGGSTPLVELDVREFQATSGPDAGVHESMLTTLRLRAVATYEELGLEVPAEVRQTFIIRPDVDLLEGFPIRFGGSIESGVKLADLNGDGQVELIVATGDGRVHALSMVKGEASPLNGFPAGVSLTGGLVGATEDGSYLAAPAYQTLDVSLARQPILATPAIGDIDADGSLEIVVATIEGTVTVVRSDGSTPDGWPRTLPNVPSCRAGAPTSADELCMSADKLLDRGVLAHPSLADLNDDGLLEILIAAFDGSVYAFTSTGEIVPGWPVRIHFPGMEAKEYSRIASSPAIADFNGDGLPDVLVGSNERIGSSGSAGAYYVLGSRGSTSEGSPFVGGWPISVASLDLFSILAQGTSVPAAVVDFDSDQSPEAVLQGNGSLPRIVPASPNLQSELGGAISNERFESGLQAELAAGTLTPQSQAISMAGLFSSPSVGDLDRDGTPDVATAGATLALIQSLFTNQPRDDKERHIGVAWNGKTGRVFPSTAAELSSFAFAGTAIADITGDGYPELIQASSDGTVYARDACGRIPEGWPKRTGQWIAAAPTVGDVNGDGRLEVVVATRQGAIFAWRTRGAANGVAPWPSDGANNANTRVPARLPASPTVAPLGLDADGRCVLQPTEPEPAPTRLRLSGGCSCRSVSGPRTSAALLPLLGFVWLCRVGRRRPSGIAAALMRRRR